MHRPHGDIHEIGLQDDCERCIEHAQNPLRDLDHDMLGHLVFAAFHRATYEPRTHTEAVAIASVLTQMEKCGALFSVAHSPMIAYLNQNWRIPITWKESL